mmetsp:Transcript_6876/g.16241  ORF Transcript_6876/g.16241 Transcript_6876/m.16241 type:complete len:210 (+) Transcript_6876:526-1155(+)
MRKKAQRLAQTLPLLRLRVGCQHVPLGAKDHYVAGQVVDGPCIWVPLISFLLGLLQSLNTLGSAGGFLRQGLHAFFDLLPEQRNPLFQGGDHTVRLGQVERDAEHEVPNRQRRHRDRHKLLIALFAPKVVDVRKRLRGGVVRCFSPGVLVVQRHRGLWYVLLILFGVDEAFGERRLPRTLHAAEEHSDITGELLFQTLLLLLLDKLCKD